MKNAVFQLEPLTCPSCIKKIETAVGRAQGVVEAKVMFHSSKVKVSYDAKKTDTKTIQGIVEQLGYQVVA